MKGHRAKAIAVCLAGIGMLVQTHIVHASNYNLTGRVTGVRTQDNGCYIAVDDKSRGGYANAWHRATSGAICDVAKIAFQNATNVKLDASVAPGPRDANDINAIEMYWEPIKWPPYFP